MVVWLIGFWGMSVGKFPYMKSKTCILLVIIFFILTLFNWFILIEPFENLNRIILPTLGVFITLYFYYGKNENINLYA